MSEAQAPLRTLEPGARVHLIGVAGAGMNALATVLLARGYRVSGSDMQRSAQVERLVARGMSFAQGHDAAHVQGADSVIISAAVREENVELAAARARDIPVVKRAAALGWLLEGLRTIAVAGTHGKTTTTAMLAVIFRHAGLDPTFLVGGEVLDLGASAQWGTGEWAIVEADEYDRSFLQLRPEIAVITNVEPDHLEYYGSVAAMHEAYMQFVARIRPGGTLVVNDDDPYLAQFVGPPGVQLVRCAYGAPTPQQWQASDFQQGAASLRFTLRQQHPRSPTACAGTPTEDQAGVAFATPQGEARAESAAAYDAPTAGPAALALELPLAGEHNMLNAMQAVAAATIARIPAAVAQEALVAFHGTGRRFQRVGEAAGVLVIDDYAHHPTEIRVNLAAARARFPGRRLVVVFQPHTYSRTRYLFEDFANAFDEADLLVVTDIYAARETDTLSMDAAHLHAAIAARRATPTLLIRDLAEVPTALAPQLRAGDVVLTLGAGSITTLGPRLLAALPVTG